LQNALGERGRGGGLVDARRERGAGEEVALDARRERIVGEVYLADARLVRAVEDLCLVDERRVRAVEDVSLAEARRVRAVEKVSLADARRERAVEDSLADGRRKHAAADVVRVADPRRWRTAAAMARWRAAMASRRERQRASEGGSVALGFREAASEEERPCQRLTLLGQLLGRGLSRKSDEILD
jgi:hypothetical protein